MKNGHLSRTITEISEVVLGNALEEKLYLQKTLGNPFNYDNIIIVDYEKDLICLYRKYVP